MKERGKNLNQLEWLSFHIKRPFPRKKTVKTEIDTLLVRWWDRETQILSDLKNLNLGLRLRNLQVWLCLHHMPFSMWQFPYVIPSHKRTAIALLRNTQEFFHPCVPYFLRITKTVLRKLPSTPLPPAHKFNLKTEKHKTDCFSFSRNLNMHNM